MKVLVKTLVIDMNTKIIPIALVAIIMVAGVFAFVPVQQASTVHATLTDELHEIKNTFCQAWYNDDNFDYNEENDECNSP